MLKHYPKTWILVAHRCGAVVYESEGPPSPLVEVTKFEHPTGRLRAGMVDSDRPGRSFDRKGGGRHALSTEESVVEHDQRTFARTLVESLEHGRNEHRFDSLVLIAAPKFLGFVRAAMPAALHDLVTLELPKDLARADAEDVHELLRRNDFGVACPQGKVTT